MSAASRLKRLECELDNIGTELWGVDCPPEALDGVCRKILALQVQVKVQETLHAAVNMLRTQPWKKALPHQQGIRARHFLRSVFQEGGRADGAHRSFRSLEADTLTFLGLCFSSKGLAKMEAAWMEILLRGGDEFVKRRALSGFLCRPDIEKALNDPSLMFEDDKAYHRFLQDRVIARMQQLRKRSHDEMEHDSADKTESLDASARDIEGDGASTEATDESDSIFPGDTESGPDDTDDTDIVDDSDRAPGDDTEIGFASNTSSHGREAALGQTSAIVDPEQYGDIFALVLEDLLFALASGEKFIDIFVTNPRTANKLGQRPSFLTIWLSESLGQVLSKRGTPLDFKNVAPTQRPVRR